MSSWSIMGENVKENYKVILDPNQSGGRNPGAVGKVPVWFNVLIVRTDLDFLCVGECLCVCILGDGPVAFLCINCRSW